MLGGSALTAAPASAQVSFGFNVPGLHIWTGSYDYYRPCSWYRYYDVPAPRRCFRYLSAYWGPDVYVDGDFLFRDRDDWYRWRDRPAYQHWRRHDFAYRANSDRDWQQQHGWDRGNHDHGSNGDRQGYEHGNYMGDHGNWNGHDNGANYQGNNQPNNAQGNNQSNNPQNHNTPNNTQGSNNQDSGDHHGHGEHHDHDQGDYDNGH